METNNTTTQADTEELQESSQRDYIKVNDLYKFQKYVEEGAVGSQVTCIFRNAVLLFPNLVVATGFETQKATEYNTSITFNEDGNKTLLEGFYASLEKAYELSGNGDAKRTDKMVYGGVINGNKKLEQMSEHDRKLNRERFANKVQVKLRRKLSMGRPNFYAPPMGHAFGTTPLTCYDGATLSSQVVDYLSSLATSGAVVDILATMQFINIKNPKARGNSRVFIDIESIAFKSKMVQYREPKAFTDDYIENEFSKGEDELDKI